MCKKFKTCVVTLVISMALFLNGCAADGTLTNEGKVALGVGGAILATGLILGAVALSHTPKVDINPNKIHIGT